MKRIFCVFIILCVLAALTSCDQSENMGTLTSYQQGDFSAEAVITLRGESYRAEIEQRGGRLTFRFKEPKNLADFKFIFTQGGAAISAGDMEIPLAGGRLWGLSALAELFRIPTEGAWKIKRASPGGVDVFLCKNGDTVLYIDANSLLPLKIAIGGTVADILRFTAE